MFFFYDSITKKLLVKKKKIMFLVLMSYTKKTTLKKKYINIIWPYMKRLYSRASTILSKLTGKPFKGLVFKGLGLVLNQATFYWIKRLKNVTPQIPGVR